MNELLELNPAGVVAWVFLTKDDSIWAHVLRFFIMVVSKHFNNIWALALLGSLFSRNEDFHGHWASHTVWAVVVTAWAALLTAGEMLKERENKNLLNRLLLRSRRYPR